MLLVHSSLGSVVLTFTSPSLLAPSLFSTMYLFVVLLTTICSFLLSPPAVANLTKPRILASLSPYGYRFPFDKEENATVLYHESGSTDVLVGAEDVLYGFYFSNSTAISKTLVNFTATDHSYCKEETHCKNYLTVLQKFQGNVLVCGTNAYNPTCWNLADTNKIKTKHGPGFSPFIPDQNLLILFSDNDVYSTIGKSQNAGKVPRFRRVYGRKPDLYTKDNLMTNPHYVKVITMDQKESYKDKIYLFFREDNLEKNVDVDITVSRVAQLCKGDEGGEGGQASSMWSTFLKARLECGYPNNGRFYSRLRDIYTLHCNESNETRLYGVFSSPWNDTAVCVYSMGEIERVFRTSPFKGNKDKENSTIRPGECLAAGTKTPAATFTMASEHPEMEQGVKPIGKKPLFHSHAHYRRIVVDQVNSVENISYNVLLLTTVNGTIHKFLELNQSVVNILEIQPFKTPAPIQSMELDSITKRLYITSSQEVVEVPLDWCDGYQQNYKSCIMAMDPYCGWKNGKCMSILEDRRSMMQNISSGLRHGCYNLTGNQDEDSKHEANIVQARPFSSLFFSCPVVSHHAKYYWLYNNTIQYDCLLGHPSHQCIHLLATVTDDHYGKYTCMSKEGEVILTVAEYVLAREITQTPTSEKLVAGHGSMVGASLWLIVVNLLLH